MFEITSEVAQLIAENRKTAAIDKLKKLYSITDSEAISLINEYNSNSQNTPTMSSLTNKQIFENGIPSAWLSHRTSNDTFFWPRSDIRSQIRQGFGIQNYDEEIFFLRDTSFWDSKDQGLVITESAIYFRPDNESDNMLIVPFYKVRQVSCKDQVLFFDDGTNEPYQIHICHFLKNDDTRADAIGKQLASVFTKMGQNSIDPSDVADQKIQELVDKDNYKDAIVLVRDCIRQFPQYGAWYNERLAMCYFFTKEYENSIKAANAGLQLDCTDEQAAQLCLWKYSSNEELGNWEDARKDALLVALNGRDVQNDEGMSQRDYAQNDFFRLNDQFVEHFLEMPYQQRKILMVVENYQSLYQDHLQVLGTRVVQNLAFPVGHPIANQLYVGHPLIPNKYIPFDSYQLEFVEDKVREFCQLVQCLGATEITIDCLNSSVIDNTTSGHQNARGSVDTWYDVTGGHSKEYKYHMIEELSKSISLHQTFQPKVKPYVPEGLVWYNSEPSWQRLVSQRINGGLSSHEERIETKKSQMFDGRELTEVKAEVKSLIIDMGMNFDKTEEQKFTQQENAVLSIKVSFAPIHQLNGTQQGSSMQPSSDTFALSSPEQEYLDEVKECLADGEIGPRERRLLDKIRSKLGISAARASELEASLSTPKLTEDEQEYLKEYKECAIDGIVSDKERRLLDKVRKMLGISEERAAEIEKLIK